MNAFKKRLVWREVVTRNNRAFNRSYAGTMSFFVFILRLWRIVQGHNDFINRKTDKSRILESGKTRGKPDFGLLSC